MQLKHEARSVVHFKEVSYKLENKVVELTQTLQKRTAENRDLQSKLRGLEDQVKTWIVKFEDSDTRVKSLHAEAQKPTVPRDTFDALDAQKRDTDSRLEATLKKIAEHEAQIAKLNADFAGQTKQIEEQQEALKATAANGAAEDSATVTSLRAELSSLREQLTRQVALNTAQKVAPVRPEGAAFNMATGRNAAENGAIAGVVAGAAAMGGAGLAGQGKRRARRHSDLGTDAQNGTIPEDDRWEAPRAVSVAFPQEAAKRLQGNKSYLPDVYDDPAEEIMKLLEDEEPLDEDVLSGIIRHLKIPSPNLQNPPSPKEVLFPAHLISLVTNEMWKYGMMRESERFLANVMQTIQQHVMVRPRLALPCPALGAD